MYPSYLVVLSRIHFGIDLCLLIDVSYRSLAALEHPALFSAIVLVDPIIRPFPTMGKPFFTPGLRQNVLGAVQRRDHWATR